MQPGWRRGARGSRAIQVLDDRQYWLRHWGLGRLAGAATAALDAGLVHGEGTFDANKPAVSLFWGPTIMV